MDLFKGNQQRARRNGGSPKFMEKNYFFLKKGELPRIDLSRFTSAQRYYGKLFLTVTALQEMFIGSGEIDEHQQRFFDAFSYVKKQPGHQVKLFSIPGSSMKGSVLTNLQMFLELRSTDFFSAQEGMAKVYFADCTIDTIDAAVLESFPERHEPKRKMIPPAAEIKLYLKDDAAYGKFTSRELKLEKNDKNEYIQAVKKGSRFNGFINFKTLTRYEMAFLVLSMGSLPGHLFNFKIGGAKNRGMGLVRVAIDWHRSFVSENLLNATAANGTPLRELEPQLVSTVSGIAEANPKLAGIVKKMQEEYGHE